MDVSAITSSSLLASLSGDNVSVADSSSATATSSTAATASSTDASSDSVTTGSSDTASVTYSRKTADDALSADEVTSMKSQLIANYSTMLTSMLGQTAESSSSSNLTADTFLSILHSCSSASALHNMKSQLVSYFASAADTSSAGQSSKQTDSTSDQTSTSDASDN